MTTSYLPAPPGFKWVCCRYKQAASSTNEYLDAYKFGLKAWCFLVPAI